MVQCIRSILQSYNSLRDFRYATGFAAFSVAYTVSLEPFLFSQSFARLDLALFMANLAKMGALGPWFWGVIWGYVLVHNLRDSTRFLFLEIYVYPIFDRQVLGY